MNSKNIMIRAVIFLLKKISACILAAVLLLFLIELNNFDFDSEAIYVDDVAESDDIDQQELYNDLFDHSSVVKIDINISRKELAKIQSDYDYYKAKMTKTPIYRKAESVTFTVNGKKYIIKEVGIRMKGSSTLSNFYNDILGTYNLVSFKLKFNETFDDKNYYSTETKRWNNEEEREQRENRRFATLQKLDVKWNANFDSTYVRNMYVHDMYKDYGILSQSSNLAVFSLGGSQAGIYKIFEPVDDIFLNRYLPIEEQGGDLYKANRNGGITDYTLTNTYTSTGNGMSDISPYSDIAEGEHVVQTNPLINLTVTKDGLYKDKYTEYLKSICRGRWMAYGNFENYYNKAKRNYGEYIISNLNYCSTMGHNLEFSTEGGPDYNDNMSVKEFMDKIKQTVDAAI